MSIASTPPGEEPAVLIVDDQRSGLVPLRRLLELEGFRVIEALSAHAALAALESGPISVILADWIMPVRDGISLLDEVAERWPAVERVLYTGHYDAELVLEAHGAKHLAVSKSQARLVVDIVRRLHRRAMSSNPGPPEEPTP